MTAPFPFSTKRERTPAGRTDALYGTAQFGLADDCWNWFDIDDARDTMAASAFAGKAAGTRTAAQRFINRRREIVRWVRSTDLGMSSPL